MHVILALTAIYIYIYIWMDVWMLCRHVPIFNGAVSGHMFTIKVTLLLRLPWHCPPGDCNTKVCSHKRGMGEG